MRPPIWLVEADTFNSAVQPWHVPQATFQTAFPGNKLILPGSHKTQKLVIFRERTLNAQSAMVEPPFKRARRRDSKQMWDEADKRAPIKSRERDEPPRKRKDDGDRDRDRQRRYRSRSPIDSRDSRGGKDRDRGRDSRGGGRGREDRDRDGRRDARNVGQDRKDRGEYDDDRSVLVHHARSNAQKDTGRDSRDKPRERSRSRDQDRRRSRSPRKEREPEAGHKPKPKPVNKQPEEDLIKSRTATPPVSFKVGGHDHDRMDTDGDHKQLHAKGGAKKEKIEEQPIEDDEIVIEDDGMAAMQAIMGFGGFGTTHQKKVPGNDVSAVRKEKKTEYRQYMNRVGGFNRPLSPTRE